MAKFLIFNFINLKKINVQECQTTYSWAFLLKLDRLGFVPLIEKLFYY